jgi:hypothetical protein
MYCQNCRTENEAGTNFCRFCGFQFPFAKGQAKAGGEHNSPRPYLWQTDEFQVRSHAARKTQEIQNMQPLAQPLNAPHPHSAMIYQQPAPLAAGYRCPNCGTHALPYLKRQISTAGWITFAILLVMTFIFFWVGFLLKEDVRICPVCNYRVG